MAKAQRICSMPNCNNAHYGRGWCHLHYKRWRKHGDPSICLVPQPEEGAPIAFLDTALAHVGDDCLIWPFARSTTGRGQVWLDGKLQFAHRVVCRRAHGDPPSTDYEVAHSCGRGHEGCVAPSHLRWTTHTNNMADTLLHGTRTRGERTGTSKLKEPDVLAIMSSKGVIPQRRLARLYGVSAGTIGDIHSGRRWSWLTAAPGP